MQEFLDQVLAGAKRQVLIEATVAEVQLSNQYQRGIDWQRLRSGAAPSAAGFAPAERLEFGRSTGTPAGGQHQRLRRSAAPSPACNFNFALSLLESFGDVRVLSSPKLSVLNNQTAMLRVTRDIIYFTDHAVLQPITVAGGGSGTVVAPALVHHHAERRRRGLHDGVLPQINEADSVVLNVRPTIRRRVGNARDPNPALAGAATQPESRSSRPASSTRSCACRAARWRCSAA